MMVKLHWMPYVLLPTTHHPPSPVRYRFNVDISFDSYIYSPKGDNGEYISISISWQIYFIFDSISMQAALIRINKQFTQFVK